MDKWSIERDPSTLMCHYIAKKNTVLSRISGACEANVTELPLGMLVEVREEQADGGLRIRVNGTNNEKIWHKTEWRCHKIDLIKVPTLVWQFLAAIPVLQERVEIASNERLCQEAAKFKNDINVWYRSFRNAEQTLAVIRYIGPAPDLGPGFHFGLELLVRFLSCMIHCFFQALTLKIVDSWV